MFIWQYVEGGRNDKRITRQKRGNAVKLSSAAFKYNLSFLFLGSVQTGSHAPLDLSGSSTVCFPLQCGDRFGQGRQGSLFSPPGSLKWRGGKLKTGFTRFLETVKQAGGPTVRERGKERPCDRESAVWEREEGQTETSSQQIRNMCEMYLVFMCLPVCVKEKMIER